MRHFGIKVLQAQAYDYIKAGIIDGTLVFNQIYSETRLAQEIGISRTPVRDAIHILYQEGLVDIIPNKGFVLHKITKQDIIETYEVRSAVESYCARKLALSKEPEKYHTVIPALTASLERQQQIFNQGGSPELFAKEDRNFHYLLVSASENEEFINIFSRYMYWIEKLAVDSLAAGGRMEQTLTEHRRILDAIGDGAEQYAYQSMMAHIRAPLDINLEGLFGE